MFHSECLGSGRCSHMSAPPSGNVTERSYDPRGG
jgi:hypothetical protein